MALWVLKENLLLNRFNDIGHNRHIIPFLKRKRIDIEYYKGYEDFERMRQDPTSVLYFPSSLETEHINTVKLCNFHDIPVLCVDSSLLHGVTDCYFSSISSSDQQSMPLLLSYCEQHGRHNLAFWGANPHYVDLHKIRTLYNFKENFTEEDMFFLDDGFEGCFERFFENRHKYDAIICANDIYATFFIHKMQERDKDYLEKTFVISFMNTILSQVMEYSITSITYDRNILESAVYDIYKSINKHREHYDGISITLKTTIFPRNSTRDLPFSKDYHISQFPFSKPPAKLPDPIKSNESRGENLGHSVDNILLVEQLLQSSDINDLKIIYMFMEGYSNEETCSKLFLSLPTVKYRSSEMFRIVGVKNKKMFIDLIEKFVDPAKLQEYIVNLSNEK